SGDFQLNGTSQCVLKTWELRSDEKFLFGSDSDLSFSKERFYEAGVIRQSYISGAKVGLSGMWQRTDALNIVSATYQVQHNSTPNLYGTRTIHALSAQLSFNQSFWKHLRV